MDGESSKHVTLTSLGIIHISRPFIRFTVHQKRPAQQIRDRYGREVYTYNFRIGYRHDLHPANPFIYSTHSFSRLQSTTQSLSPNLEGTAYSIPGERQSQAANLILEGKLFLGHYVSQPDSAGNLNREAADDLNGHCLLN